MLNQRSLTILLNILLGVVIIYSWYNIYTIKKSNIIKENNQVSNQMQKFKFGEQCPDGLRVEYISTIRLPKSVICQKAVGE